MRVRSSEVKATADRAVWVPSLWVVEMANLLRSAQRRRRVKAAQRIELAAAAPALRLQECREPVSLPTLDALATLDDALMKAMRKAGVPRADP